MTTDNIYRIFDIASLIEKHIQGTLTANEQQALLKWIDSDPANSKLFNEVTQLTKIEEFNTAYLSVDTELELNRFKQRYPLKQHKKNLKFYKWLPYAAAIFLVLFAGLWIYTNSNFEQNPVAIKPKAYDIIPGSQKAVLKLSNGRSIALNEAQNGIVINGQKISYQNGTGEVANLSGKVEQLMLSTPKAGTYAVTLSDGTRIWLNAQSTLTYPLRFDGKERVVKLDGEAYFDVAKSEKPWPFRVLSRNQSVEVLGTEFNIMAYPDVLDIKTTLIEGSVRLSQLAQNKKSAVVLKPGQQGIITSGNANIAVMTVDIETSIAWKEGFFYFKNTPIAELMKQVERWYGVEVHYTEDIPKETFSGKVKRNTSLLGLIEILRVSKIDATLEKNQLIIN